MKRTGNEFRSDTVLKATSESNRLRRVLPADVLAVALPPVLLSRVCELLGSTLRVHSAATFSDAAAQLRGIADVCCLAMVPGPLQSVVAERTVGIRKEFPHVNIIALFSVAHSDSRWILRFGKAGITELLSLAPNLSAEPLFAALSRCHQERFSVKLYGHCALKLPVELEPLFRAALRLAHEPISLEKLASAERMHERSLRKFCDRSQIPSPQWIIGWARLLVAAYYLEEPGRTVQSVADLLGFADAIALSNQIRRYTGIGPAALRESGAAHTAARAFEAWLGKFLEERGNASRPTLRLMRG